MQKASNTNQKHFKYVGAYWGNIHCSYSIYLDIYSGGCTFNCHYCYSKDMFSDWNKMLSLVNVKEIEGLFYRTFEENKSGSWEAILRKKTPIRMGAYSDCFMPHQEGLQRLRAVLEVFKKYNYPILIITKSTLIKDFVDLLSPERCVIQVSVCNLPKYSCVLEPNAPSFGERLDLARWLVQQGFIVDIRLNPVVPTWRDDEEPDVEFVKEVVNSGIHGIVAGLLHLSSERIAEVGKIVGYNLRDLMSEEMKKRTSGFSFSDQASRRYMRKLKEVCDDKKVLFSCCYLGGSESAYSLLREFWDGDDCCQLKKRVPGFTSNCDDLSAIEKIKLIEDAGWIKRTITLIGNYIIKKVTP